MKTLNLVFFLIALYNVCVLIDGHNTCVWYGQCGKSGPKIQTCVSNDIAQPIGNETATNILRKRCPHLFENTGQYNFSWQIFHFAYDHLRHVRFFARQSINLLQCRANFYHQLEYEYGRRYLWKMYHVFKKYLSTHMRLFLQYESEPIYERH